MPPRHVTRRTQAVLGLAMAIGGAAVAPAGPGLAQAAPVVVTTASEWVAAWGDPTVAAIELGADVELECVGGPVRLIGAVPIVVDGAGHTLTDGCVGGSESGTTMAVTPSTWSDIALVGAADGFTNVLMGGEVHLDGVTITVRNGGTGVVATGAGSTIADTVVDTGADAGAIGVAARGPVTIDRTEIVGAGDGIDARDDGASVTVRDSRLAVGHVGVWSDGTVVVERSSVQGSRAALLVAAGTLTAHDSTLVLTEAAGPGATVDAGSGGRDVRLDQVTVVAPPDRLAIELADGAEVVLHASVLAAGSEPCVLVGGLVSEGDNVASGACGLLGPGDRVLADVGLDALDPATGLARPVAGGPLVDAVADCRSTSDQRGVARPQGPACDIGAVELEQADPPGSTTSTVVSVPAGPPPVAPPAAPVSGTARFTG